MNNPDVIHGFIFLVTALSLTGAALLLFSFKNSLYYILASVNIYLYFIPVFFSETTNYSHIIYIGSLTFFLILYPLYIILTFNSYLKNYYKFFLVIPLFTVLLSSYFNSNATLATISLFMMFSALLAMLTLMKNSFSKKILQVIIILSILLLTFSLISHIHKIVDYIPAATFIITLLLNFFDYRTKVTIYIEQLNKSYEINMKTIHQITRLQQSNDQFRKIIEEKDQELFQISRHASLAEITTGIGHEIAQPLTGIKGIAQNMIDDINYEEFDKLQAIAELTRISVLVDKASSIIDHIRNFSKKSGFNKRAIIINNAVNNALELVKLQLEKNKINFSLSLDENLNKIYGDSLSIEQVVVNVILNAKDALLEKRNYNPDFIPHISASTYNHNDIIILEIEDNGTGIPREIRSKIWSPFFTSKKKMSGTGMGLSISYKIIKEHDGTAALDTGEDFTRFTFSFPLYDAK